MAEKKKLTQKEAKIALKRSGMFDSNTKGLPLPKKSDKKTIKAAASKGSGKPKYKGVDESQRKATNKGQTIFGGSSRSNTKTNAPIVKSIKQESTKSRTPKPKTPKVPVKPRGGMRGGGMLGGGGGMSRANR